ncbi:MAG: hypothetical protein DME24_11915, partial [Verrucomicrobia bacterium]
ERGQRGTQTGGEREVGQLAAGVFSFHIGMLTTGESIWIDDLARTWALGVICVEENTISPARDKRVVSEGG